MLIDSLLDTDLYKFTMMQAVLHRFPGATVEYQFHCRSPLDALHATAAKVRAELADLCQLGFRKRELDYLRSLRYIKPDFVEILRVFRLQPDHVDIREENGGLAITIRGPWLHTILFEVPLLAIVSELNGQAYGADTALAMGEARLAAKISQLTANADTNGLRFAEFGTRRRYSHAWQWHVLERLAHDVPDRLAGTSNVLAAMELGLTPVGTMAHEFLQACQAVGPRLADSQRFALETWAQEYRGDLGIALTDVIGLDAFLHDFDLYFCKLFDGVRHDSGDPIAWGERILEHYAALRVDALTKTLVFSDGLDFTTAIDLYRHFRGRARVTFGIGTFLTNDMGFSPPSIVIKMTRCNGQAVAKISDEAAKTLCVDPGYLTYLKSVFAT